MRKISELSQKCREAGINIAAARIYKYKHPELTEDEVIQHYNTKCYYNILGEFIIVPL